MPHVRVTGRKYPSFLISQRGWQATTDGAELYVQPREIWASHRDAAGRHTGPKEQRDGNETHDR